MPGDDDKVRGQVIGGDGMGRLRASFTRTRDILMDEHFGEEKVFRGKVERSVLVWFGKKLGLKLVNWPHEF